MKSIFIYILPILFFLSACEHYEKENRTNEEQEILFNIESRSNDIKINPDDTIKWVRILAFDPPTEKCVYNKLFRIAFQDSILTENGSKKLVAKVAFRMKLDTIYHFVFIANEKSDPDQTRLDRLAALTESNTMSELDDMSFSADAFHKDKPIPMTTMIKNVRITATAAHSINQGALISGPIQATLERLGVRLDLTLQTEIEEKKNFLKYLNVCNLPKHVPLFEKANNGSDINYTDTRIPPRTIVDFSDNTEVWNVSISDEGKNVWTWKQTHIIIPSIIFSDKSDEAKAIDLRVTYTDPIFTEEGISLGINTPNTTYTEYYDPPQKPLPGEPYNYTLPHNTRLELTGIIKEFNIILNSIKVSGWYNKKDVELED
ncbi:hypothetical protein [Bacteroides sp. 519]|uniref:hypothetical protein n=1 Tax=Bacteroides sp. 519 TaxID=2302937 RepID=UPI0013D4D307|nr:hypothetical protein [Bacteroides sp. 519]NDV58333.1 hypothetical protein [Bacteroides sp. 519]